MRRHLLLALALLSLFTVSLAVSDRTTDRSGDFAPAPPKPPAKPQAPSALAKVKNIANNVVNNVKKLIAGARAGVKKEIDGVKLYLKKKWKDAQQLYQYTRYCLNHRAPKKLKLKLPNSALCSTVKKAHPIFTTAIEKIVSRIPVPSLKQTIAAELVGERHPRPQPQRRRPGHSALLEVGSHNPGSPTLKWPSSLISYALSPDLDPAAVVNFQWGVNHIEAMTCIRFQQIEFNVTGDGIQVIPSSTMCAAIVGYQGPENQNLWWGPDCAPGSAVHELLHALGFDHTQNRLDRDLYLQVDMARIQPENQHNFEKRSPPFQDYGPYDFMSILHYPNNAFSLKDDDPGMVEVVERPESTPPALNSPWNGDAQRDSMTEGDVAAVAAIYSC